MKKYISLSAILLMIVFTGCVKNYNCQCTAYTPNLPGSPTAGTSSFNVKGTSKNAKAECEGHSIPADQHGNQTVCEIR